MAALVSPACGRMTVIGDAEDELTTPKQDTEQAGFFSSLESKAAGSAGARMAPQDPVTNALRPLG